MQGFSKAIVSSGSHKIPYRQFEVMKSILGDTPNVEPVLLDIGSILDDNNNNFNEDSSHNDEGESGVNDNDKATISSLSHTANNDSDSNVNDK